MGGNYSRAEKYSPCLGIFGASDVLGLSDVHAAEMETFGTLEGRLIQCKKVCEKFHKRSHPLENLGRRFFGGASLFEFPPRDARGKKSGAAEAREPRPRFFGIGRPESTPSAPGGN